jgi:arsenate reductase (thioredoxin)
MAEGYLKTLGQDIEVFSAGIRPEKVVSPLAVEVMKEHDIDISRQIPVHVSEFTSRDWDYVITLSNEANTSCPEFSGRVGQRFHIVFDDPADATGTDMEKLAVYSRLRDEIEESFLSFYHAILYPDHRGGCGCNCGC